MIIKINLTFDIKKKPLIYKKYQPNKYTILKQILVQISFRVLAKEKTRYHNIKL